MHINKLLCLDKHLLNKHSHLKEETKENSNVDYMD